jgi:hypothetical protein
LAQIREDVQGHNYIVNWLTVLYFSVAFFLLLNVIGEFKPVAAGIVTLREVDCLTEYDVMIGDDCFIRAPEHNDPPLDYYALVAFALEYCYVTLKPIVVLVWQILVVLWGLTPDSTVIAFQTAVFLRIFQIMTKRYEGHSLESRENSSVFESPQKILDKRIVKDRDLEARQVGSVPHKAVWPGSQILIAVDDKPVGSGVRLGEGLSTLLHVYDEMVKATGTVYICAFGPNGKLRGKVPFVPPAQPLILCDRTDSCVLAVPDAVWTQLGIRKAYVANPRASQVISVFGYDGATLDEVSTLCSIGSVLSATQVLAFYHNATTSPGWSGAPCFNMQGHVVGLHAGADNTTLYNFGQILTHMVAHIGRVNETTNGNEDLYKEVPDSQLPNEHDFSDIVVEYPMSKKNRKFRLIDAYYAEIEAWDGTDEGITDKMRELQEIADTQDIDMFHFNVAADPRMSKRMAKSKLNQLDHRLGSRVLETTDVDFQDGPQERDGTISSSSSLPQIRLKKKATLGMLEGALSLVEGKESQRRSASITTKQSKPVLQLVSTVGPKEPAQRRKDPSSSKQANTQVSHPPSKSRRGKSLSPKSARNTPQQASLGVLRETT